MVSARRVDWVDRLAHVISAVASPAVLVSLVLLTLPLRDPGASWLSALVAAAFTTGIPWGALLMMRARGKVSDLHVTRREQRWPILLLSVVSILLGLLLLSAWLHAGVAVREVALVLVGLLVTGAVTLFWKISLHAAVAAYCCLHVLAGTVLGAHLALAVVMAVAWARVQIRHHTLTQVTMGTLVGALVSLLGWALSPLG